MRRQDAGLVVGICVGASCAFIVTGVAALTGAGLSGPTALALAVALGAVGFVLVLVLGRRYLWARRPPRNP